METPPSCSRSCLHLPGSSGQKQANLLDGPFQLCPLCSSGGPGQDIGDQDRMMSRLEAEMQVEPPDAGEFTFALLDKGNGKALGVAALGVFFFF